MFFKMLSAVTITPEVDLDIRMRMRGASTAIDTQDLRKCGYGLVSESIDSDVVLALRQETSWSRM